MENKYNRCINSFSTRTVKQIIDSVRSVHFWRTPLVSVGSGKAFLEQHILAEAPYDKKPVLFCVDPDPTSWTDVKGPVQIQPVAASTSDLMKKHPELKRNCTLLLNWPSPDSYHRHRQQKIPWDLESILLLQPESVIIVFECTHDVLGANGASGSKELHRWSIDTKSGYTPRYRCTLTERKAQDMFEFCPSILWLYRSDLFPSRLAAIPLPPAILPDHIKEYNDEMIDYNRKATMASMRSLGFN